MKKLRSLGVVSCILAVIYLITWLIGPILIWTGIDRNGLFYGVVLACGLLPAETFIISLWIGTRDIPAKRKWSAPIIFGMAYILNCICADPSILLELLMLNLSIEFNILFCGSRDFLRWFDGGTGNQAYCAGGLGSEKQIKEGPPAMGGPFASAFSVFYAVIIHF